MRKGFIIIFIFVTIIAPPCWGSEKTNYNASVIAMDSIINYYSSMAKLRAADQPGTLDCEKRRAYFCKNRNMLITQIAQTKTFSHLTRAHQICENSYKSSFQHFPSTKLENFINEGIYFDCLTSHKYIKKDNDTYAEFTKKGDFLKIVSSDLPLLNKSRSIHPINQDSYILYEKYLNGKIKYMFLPGREIHPKGWKANKLLIALK